ncbi:segregation/condensation protein A [Streptomyces sp. TX20-6-3]|uniref:segregation/condensation protein A n=1 Tax=Streptomyces sp. TX20-6-3 TaxID=3028705 RepID=UPI0029AC110C|nr:segregation/condensation protein A [Streptomyces sp. TX20-6-3]MDX2563678.1 segregation/condensation protein A [Streptomyces sp. TX20-6-3]
MHHASDETSRPPRRRALGRGPADPEGPAAARAAGAGRDGHGARVGATGTADAARAPDDAAAAPTDRAHEPEPEPAAGREPVPEAGREPEPAAGWEPVPDAGREPVPESGFGPEAESGAESPSESEVGSVRVPPAGPEAGPEPEPEPKPGSVTVPPAGAESVPGPEIEPVPAPAPADALAPASGGDGGDGRFTVRLANFEGPFDLLLQLITKHKLDVTEVALSQVTDEFMAHLRALGPEGDLDQTTEFLVVAATLLDLKAARLLPAAEVEDEADLALLEARDLLFARLLQYRAYKRIAAIFEERWEAEGRRHPRTVGLEPHHAELLPEVVISIGAEGFARLAVKAMQPKAEPQVYVDHIHAPLVSVREQAAVVVSLLRERGTALFRELIEDVGDDTLTVVARFLALLELYREKAVALDQETALGDLTVSWTGGETDPTAAVTDEFDQETTA